MLLVAPIVLASAGVHADVVYENDFESGQVGSEWSDTTHAALGGQFGSFLGRFERSTVRLTLGGDDGNGGGEPGTGSGGASNGGFAQPYNGSRGGPQGGSRGGSPGGLIGALDGAPVRAFHDRPDTGGGNGGGNPGAEPGLYTLTFDLYLFDSWDGLDPTFGTDRFQVVANGNKIFDHALETFEPWENALGGWERPSDNVYAGWASDLMYRGLTMNFLVEAGSPLIEIDFISLQNQVLIDESWGIDNVRLSLTQGRSVAVPAPSAAVALLGGLLGMSKRRRV